MNLLRGDLPRLSRTTSIVTASAASDIKRSKPLKYAYEKEIVLYAHHKRLDYFTTECIYSPEAFRGSARTLIKNLERVRPSAILDVVRSGEDMARLVPPEVSNSSADPANNADLVVAVDGEAEGEGGCGSINGRASGGEMAAMEQKLRDGEGGAKGRETETDFTGQGQRHDRSKAAPTAAKMAKKLPKQQLQKCGRCGYLSSQSVCKACMLLEGLNKNRPRTEIRVSVEEEDSSPTLTRRMEGMTVAPTDIT